MPQMTKYQKGTQIWAALTVLARARQSIYYGDVATAVGYVSIGVGAALGPIAYYCELNDLPPLTSLVVNEADGEPGPGYPVRKTAALDQQSVWAYDWFPHWACKRLAPTAEELEEAERVWKERHRKAS